MGKKLLNYSLPAQLDHGMEVSNLAYLVAKELQLSEEECNEIAIAGLLHDIGKASLEEEIPEENPLMVEQMKIIRLHPKRGYEILKRHGYDESICKSVLTHHENYDGTGYPNNLYGDKIPLAGRILRVCDVFSALTDDRSYRRAYKPNVAFDMMMHEIKNYDVRVFLAMQRVLHNNEGGELKKPEKVVDMRGELLKL